MRVSVVVTTYNLSKYIGECITSILHQTYKPYEIIIADDCSTDNTLELARELCGDVIIVRQERNAGALLNTLSGLNRASGDIVSFIDGDDTWPPNKLERVVQEFLCDDKVFFVTHGHRRVNSNGIPVNKTDETHRNIARLLQIPDEQDRQLGFRNSILRRQGVWFGSAYSLRLSAVDLVQFNSLVKDDPNSSLAYLDLVLAPFVTQTNPDGKIAYLDDVVFDYRLHDSNSAISNTVEKQFKAINRGRASTIVTRKVLGAAGADNITLHKFDTILKEYDFLESLYLSRRLDAISTFLTLIPYFKSKGILRKELLRLMAVIIIGPSNFCKIK